MATRAVGLNSPQNQCLFYSSLRSLRFSNCTGGRIAQATLGEKERQKGAKMNDRGSRFSAGESLITCIQEEQLERFRRVGDLWKSQIADWEDLARAEDAIRREYSGRYLFELVQNASDAIANGIEQGKINSQEGWVRIWLTGSSLLVANTGMPFLERDVRALCRLHVTTKSLSKQIGHKGVGFKSVLEITESPEVYSDRFAFGFDRQEVIQRIRAIVGAQDIPETSIPLLRVPSVRNLEHLPLDEREVIEKIFDAGYVTIVRLPLKSDALVARVEERMRAELNGQILLFLEPVAQLEVRYPSDEDVAFWREEIPLSAPGCKEVLLWRQDGNASGYLESRWLVVTQQLEIPDPEFVEGLGEIWKEVRAVRCMAAFPLSADGKCLDTGLDMQNFYVYFPTEEPSGLRFLVNADFYIETARRDVRRNPLNDWLTKELALLIAHQGVQTLCLKFPNDPDIVDILAPVGYSARDFGKYFLENYLSALSGSPFVPVGSGQYKPPQAICFPPKESNSCLFRSLFSPEGIPTESRWAFPTLDVEERESLRWEPFLAKIGARYLEIHDIVEMVKNGPPIPIERQGEFLKLLADWWDCLNYAKKAEMIQALKGCPIVPTFSGWRRPSECLIFQANLREKEDISVPSGFQFEMVPLEAYGEERSYEGRPARFLRALGVNPYEARDILRSAILPILCTPERFEALLRDHPNAIYEAYVFLKRYCEQRGSVEQIRESLPKVPVPAYCLKSPSRREWRPASQVYFSSYWTESEALEALYGQFDDAYFLGPIEEIPELEDPIQRQSWYGFFTWLGVSPRPRVIPVAGDWGWYGARYHHPFHDRCLWADYLEDYENAFNCDNPHRNHGRSRLMGENWALDRFEEIVMSGDVRTLQLLFCILGIHWKEYKNYLETEVKCQYTTTGCRGQKIPSYLMYCLQEMEWIPVLRAGHIDARPCKPRKVWFWGEAVPRIVQQMLPTLPEDLLEEKYRAIRSDLFRERDTLDDYLDLLKSLPKDYPLDPPSLEGADLQKWQEAVRTLFNWIAQTLQNGLARSGSGRIQRPHLLKVLAYQGDIPHYVDVEDSALVYPDDPLLAKTWKRDLFYLQIDEDWVSLREWLGVRKLSERVQCDVRVSGELPAETRRVQAQLQEVCPYLLALVHEQQPSRFDRVISRLRHLQSHVVEHLTIRQMIPDMDIPPRDVEEMVYLASRDEKNPHGLGSVRTGDLFIATAAMKNPDMLGWIVANYIEIPRLRDAFTILYERNGHEERMRYLISQGISEQRFREIAHKIGLISDMAISPEICGFPEVIQKGLMGEQIEGLSEVSLPSSSMSLDITQGGC